MPDHLKCLIMILRTQTHFMLLMLLPIMLLMMLMLLKMTSAGKREGSPHCTSQASEHAPIALHRGWKSESNSLTFDAVILNLLQISNHYKNKLGDAIASPLKTLTTDLH